MQTFEGEHISLTGYSLETLHDDGRWYRASSVESLGSNQVATEPIENLILCVKAPQTVAALRPLQQRLTSQSNILFLQNGASIIEEVNTHLFRDPQTRPNYLIGVISHGVTLNSPFNITHTGFAATSIGCVPRENAIAVDTSSSSSSTIPSNYLLQPSPYRHVST